MGNTWIHVKILESILQWEMYVLLFVLCLMNWGFYKLFLRQVSEERHVNLRSRFKALAKQLAILTILYFAFLSLDQQKDVDLIYRFIPYVGLITLVLGCIVFVQCCRILILQYLFLTSIRAGVPLLLVNIFTLVLSLFLASWIATTVFGIQVGPLLATSAAFSLIMGLALQDTLGNLFAGISLQLDRAFEIGDWIELQSGHQRLIGQVKEITWRATMIAGTSEESITIPNRVLAQTHVINWTSPRIPVIKTFILKFDYGSDLSKIRQLILTSIDRIAEVAKSPAPQVLVEEVSDLSLQLKIAFSFYDYSKRNLVMDKVLHECLKTLRENGIQTAIPKVELYNPPPIP